MRKLKSADYLPRVKEALAEDLGTGDVTSRAVVPARATATAVMVARQPMVVAGLAVAAAAFREVSRSTRVSLAARDGQRVRAGAVLMRLAGLARPILSAERVALNFVQRLSGVATLTAAFVRRMGRSRTRIMDTRKTTPGWRALEKYAVACGGGRNHRHGLYDLVLIKDNHLAAIDDAQPNAVAAAVARARRRFPRLRVEVEADRLGQVRQAVAAGADIILLDNMSLAQLRQAVRIVAGRARTEASGGVRLDTVAAIARTGVDFISVGQLTHSAPAVDVALDFVPTPRPSPARASGKRSRRKRA